MSTRPDRSYAQFAERDVPFEDGRRLQAARSAHNVSVSGGVGEPRLTNLPLSLTGHGSRLDDVELAAGARQRPVRALSGGRFYMSSSEDDELTDRSESDRLRSARQGYLSADEHEHFVSRAPPDACSGT